MAYIALYRKYRPQTFSDMVGQESVTKILKNQIKSGKISHAYIFSGTRGTGKTSAAKIFARAINCLNPKDGEPCNECEVCKNIIEGSTTDVVEMDAASNNSVENIRQIRQEVIYATVDVKYRVYIIDEAHMLTTSAFNALLKTLEEPPENVIFILATTEKHKIPVTILSRCLRFDFDRLSEENIAKRLKYICDKENIKYEDGVCEYVSKLADGALRDGISILDRCISEMDDELKLDDVKKIIGAIDEDILNKIVDDTYNLNAIDILKNIDEIIIKGKDLRQLVSSLNEKFLAILIKEKDDEKKKRTINIIDRLSKLDNDLKNSAKPEILLKSVMVEICNVNTAVQSTNNNKDNNNVVEILNQKIKNLENEIISLKKNGVSQNSQGNLENKINKDVVVNKTKSSNDSEASAQNSKISKNLENMNEFNGSDEFKRYILQKGHIKIYSSLASAKLYFNDKSLVIITTNSFAYNVLKDMNNIDTIKECFKDKYNNDVAVKIGLDENKNGEKLKIEELFNEKDVNYTNID